MRVGPVWRVAPLRPEREALARELGITPIIAQVLLNRDLATAAACRRFWDGDFGNLSDPGKMAGMEAAVERLRLAADRGERVLVHGDYDVDGLTGAAILLLALRIWGIQADYYIPSRLEGYGLSRQTVEAAAGNYALLVTVDCGVTAVAEVATAQEAGVDVIVTDHHLPTGSIPPAVAVLDPHREDCPYPFKELSGAGVAFRLVQAAGMVLGEVDLTPLWPLVALGTLADSVSLTGENRILVAEGLRRFWDGPPGLLALARSAGVEGAARSGALTYGVVPRLNALGRMGEPRMAVELFLTTDAAEIDAMVRAIEEANTRRRQVERGVLVEARELVSPQGKVAFVASAGWHLGVIGIVAARLATEFGRPAFVVSLEGEEGRGSARGVPGWNVHRMLEVAGSRLCGYGGHAGAAGFTVKADQVASLAADLETWAGNEPVGETASGLTIDAEVEPEQLDEAFHRELERLEPFGRGNPEPVFLARGLEVGRLRPFGGANEHLFLDFIRGGKRYPAVSFRSGTRRAELEQQAAWDLVFALEKRIFRGREEKRFRVEDFAPGAEAGAGYAEAAAGVDGICPNREQLLELYRRVLPVRATDPEDFLPLATDFLPAAGIRLGLTVFRELGLLVCDQAVWRIAPPRQRLNLDDSPTFRGGTGV